MTTFSAEFIMAVCALLGVLGTAMALVWRGGQLSNQLETARQLAEKLGEELVAAREEFKQDVRELTEKIDGLTRMVYEIRGAAGRRPRGDG